MQLLLCFKRAEKRTDLLNYLYAAINDINVATFT